MDEWGNQKLSARIDPCSLADALALGVYLGVYNSVYNEDSSGWLPAPERTNKIPKRQIELHRKRNGKVNSALVGMSMGFKEGWVFPAMCFSRSVAGSRLVSGASCLGEHTNQFWKTFDWKVILILTSSCLVHSHSRCWWSFTAVLHEQLSLQIFPQRCV